MMAVVSVSLFFLYFLYLWSLWLRVTSAVKLLCLLCKFSLKVRYLIIILWITLENWEFWFQSLFWVCHPNLYICRRLRWVIISTFWFVVPVHCYSKEKDVKIDKNTKVILKIKRFKWQKWGLMKTEKSTIVKISD